jgi:ubiquinone/menaquinone biosynthesis C-methylase UbiE
MSLYDRVHFVIINFIHHTLYDLFVDPYPPLRAAGLGPGLRVLEVGCGPGYFTVPAAKIVGESGHVVAIDTNPVAVRHVKRKVEEEELTNTEVILADAAKTGLPDSSFDVVFLFGVIHALDLTKVIPEMHRLLKATGHMSVETHGTSEPQLLRSVESGGAFRLSQKSGRVYCFDKAHVE